ncbi:MAG: DUF2799 domain-containing protein, partial [Pseudomonadota bacterium]
DDQCRVANWREVGFKDGREGREPSFLRQHRKACANVGIAPVRSEWEIGRQEGLPLYCLPSKAYRIGRSGRKISPVCTDEQLREMRPAFRHGRAYWRIEDELDDLEREADLIHRQIASLGPDDKRLRRRLRSDLQYLRLRRQQLELRQLRYSSWP